MDPVVIFMYIDKSKRKIAHMISCFWPYHLVALESLSKMHQGSNFPWDREYIPRINSSLVDARSVNGTNYKFVSTHNLCQLASVLLRSNFVDAQASHGEQTGNFAWKIFPFVSSR